MEQHLLDGSANPEWLNIKAGKFSGSDFGIYMPLLKKDELCKTTQKELCKKVLENFGYRFEQFQTPDMLIGTEREPTAREAYSFVYGKDVQEVGFVDLEKYHAGCSPDGVIYDKDSNIKEIIEIKCPSVAEFAMYLDDDYIKSNYEIQVQFNMFITGADVCHFVVYHPDFNLIVRDIPKDEEIQNKIQTALEKLQGMYNEMYERISKQKLETVGE
jgi:predicted phage-related endonuclease